MAWEREALTERIIGAAIEVHRRVGPGFPESVYEKDLIIELKKRGMELRAAHSPGKGLDLGGTDRDS
jgi:GxxExxY protein